MSDRKTVVVGVSGCVAAYKACEVVRGLQNAGYNVRVMMTQHATEFIGPTTFAGLTREEVALDLFDNPVEPITHIALAQQADLMVVVPATANIIAKMACGLADDVVTSTLIAAHCPVLVCPAMNVHMWNNPATQHNVEVLLGRGINIVQPGYGRLACGVQGNGKLASVDEIVQSCLELLEPERPFEGKHIVVSAGPTHEPIDPVRYIGNRSSGKMGYALAAQAASMGAKVTLVSGPTSLVVPCGVDCVSVETAAQMHDAVMETVFCGEQAADAFISAAAVADYTPTSVADHKLKKSEQHLDTIELEETADILHDVSARVDAQQLNTVVVGFAAETTNLLEYAQIKLESKGCSAIVANDVSSADSTFGSDTNRIAWIDGSGVEQFDLMSKDACAKAILFKLAEKLS